MKVKVDKILLGKREIVLRYVLWIKLLCFRRYKIKKRNKALANKPLEALLNKRLAPYMYLYNKKYMQIKFNMRIAYNLCIIVC